MAKTQVHWVGLSASELDLILQFDPELRPDEDIEAKYASMARWVDSVQSLIDDNIETF